MTGQLRDPSAIDFVVACYTLRLFGIFSRKASLFSPLGVTFANFNQLDDIDVLLKIIMNRHDPHRAI